MCRGLQCSHAPTPLCRINRDARYNFSEFILLLLSSGSQYGICSGRLVEGHAMFEHHSLGKLVLYKHASGGDGDASAGSLQSSRETHSLAMSFFVFTDYKMRLELTSIHRRHGAHVAEQWLTKIMSFERFSYLLKPF